jgi:hypothetical protein
MRHMLDHAREAVAIARQRSRADLDSDRMLQLALRQIIEIVGQHQVERDEVECIAVAPQLVGGRLAPSSHPRHVLGRLA